MSELFKRKTNIKSEKIDINIPITSALTPKACAHIVIEMVKYLAYQKSQIPYTYDRLKYVVDKKRERVKSASSSDDSLISQKYFRITSTAVDSLESIFKNIIKEFENPVIPEEICIVLGSNIVCAKEVYRITIPTFLKEHFNCNHSVDAPNLVRKILRSIIFKEDLQKIVCQNLSPTNMYILLKRRKMDEIDTIFDEHTPQFFLPIDILCLSQRIPQVFLNLDYNPLDVNCCNQIQIFNDSTSEAKQSFHRSTKEGCSESNESFKCSKNVHNENDFKSNSWFQATSFLKGFKACFVNGESVSDLWIK